MDPWEEFALAYVASNDLRLERRYDTFRKLMESIRSDVKWVRSASTEELRQVQNSGMIAHPHVPLHLAYVSPELLGGVDLKLTNSQSASYRVGVYDKVRAVELYTEQEAPKLTNREENMLEEAHHFMDWWVDFVGVGDDLMLADPESLSESIKQELQEKYLNNYEKIQNAGQSAYKLIGLLSQKKYGTPSTAGRVA